MFVYFVSIVTILLLIHFALNYNPKSRTIRKIPGPKISFIVGHALHVFNITPEDLFGLARKFAKQFDGIYALYSYPLFVVNIYNPEDVEIIVSRTTHHEKGYAYNFLRPWLQEGLLVSSGPKWQQRRKILTSAFHFTVLKKYFMIIQDNSRELVDTLRRGNGITVDLKAAMSEYTLNTICETAMGVKISEERATVGNSYKGAIHNLGNIMVKRFTTVYYVLDIIFNMTKFKKMQDKYLSTIQNFSGNVIERKRKLVKVKPNMDSKVKENEFGFVQNRNAMLDILIEAEKDGLIDKAGIQEEVDTFMFEGHDTVAVALTYCLLQLANEESIQEKIVAEQEGIFNGDDREATMDDLASMKYLECCLKESLRLYPPVPFMARQINQEVKLNNYIVPGNTMCCIHVYDLHRQEYLYKNPEQFDPNRFLPENCVGRHNYAYIPFSAGPRNCIGQKFAMIELKSVLSLIFRNFELIPVTKPSDLKFSADVVLRSIGPVHVKFLSRKK